MQGKKTIAFITGALFFCAAFAEVVSEELSETRTISFTKSVVVKKYKSGEVHAEPYRVQKEDTLWKILVEGYGIKDKQFYFFCRITKGLNPQLHNVDQLVPDQVVLIPFKYVTHFNIPKEQMRSIIRSVLSAHAPRVPTEDYTISKGEHLAQVLRDVYNIPDELIFNQYLDVVKKLNPGLSDVNLIRPDQKIVLPSAAAFQLSPRPEEVAGETAAPLPHAAGEGGREDDAHRVVQEKELPQQRAAAPEKPAGIRGDPVVLDPPLRKIAGSVPRSRERYIETMASLAAIFQGELHRLGDISIPVMDAGRITIDTNTFPILQLTSDKRIIVDYGDDLPAGIVDLVHLDPGNYEVIKLGAGESMKSVFDKVLNAAGYYAVDTSGNSLVIGDTVQFEVSGDWVVYGDEFIEDVRVVNVLGTGDAPLDSQLRCSLSTYGIDMVDVYMAGEGKDADRLPYPTMSETPPLPPPVPALDVSSGPVLVDSLLHLLEQQYRKDHTVRLFRGEAEGFDVEIMANRYFERGGVRHIINFQPLSGKLADVITRQGDRLFSVPEETGDPAPLLENLLDFLQVSYDAPRPGFFDTSAGKKRVGLFVPGILIKRDAGEDILLTAARVKTDIVAWLAGHGVKVVQLGSAGSPPNLSEK